MPQHLSLEVRETIRTLLLEGEKDHVDIADEAGVSIQTIKNYSSNLHNFGDILRPKVTGIGRRSILTQGMTEVCPLHDPFCSQVSRYCHGRLWGYAEAKAMMRIQDLRLSMN